MDYRGKSCGSAKCKVHDQRNVKRVPVTIESMLTPRALAIWFMDDGGARGSGCRIATHSFPRQDVELLREALSARYGFHCTLQRQGDKWALHFIKRELPLLSAIVKPSMVSSMYYKLNCPKKYYEP